MSEKIPVTIVTGFLGSGKTTLLNHLLQNTAGLKIAVLVNDFGEINIDSELITNVSGETISLANGCVCCTIRGDLIKTVIGLLEQPELPDHIVIEVSGVSDPAAAAMSFVISPQLAASVQIDSIIGVLDVDQFESVDSKLQAQMQDQIMAADVVILNKTDLAGPAKIAAAEAWVKTVSPGARMLTAVQAVVPLDLIMGTGHSRHPSSHAHSHERDHSLDYSSWYWTSENPLAFEAIYSVFKSMDPTIFRAKGFLYLGEVPDKRIILQMVGKRVTLTKGEPWGDDTRQSRIVVIGIRDGVPTKLLKEAFEGSQFVEGVAPSNKLSNAVIEILRS